MADSAMAILLSFPPENVAELSARKYDDAISTYLKSLTKVPMATFTKPLDKKNVLDFLNPEINTIPYLVALVEQSKAAGSVRNKVEAVLNQAIIFFATFDPVQARYIGEYWGQLLTWTQDALRKLGSTDLTPISTALLRLDPTAGTFTTFHLGFIRACMECGVPSQALPILDKNIYAYPTNSGKIVPDEILSEQTELSNGFITPKSGFTLKIYPEYILDYYLTGAQVYIGMRNYSRARLFLECVMLTPAQQHASSALQVEAYKKWVMVGLLAEGKTYPLPRTHDAGVIKSIKAVGRPYEALADCFQKRDWQKYQAEMDVGTQIWHEDGNLRLVKETGDALLRYRVSDLQKTYAALPVNRVASHLGFGADGTLQMLVEMIRSRHLNASITPQGNSSGDAVLRFHFNGPAALSSATQDEELAAQTKRIEDLVTFVRDADRRLQLTKEYVEYQKRQKRVGPDADMADQMDLTWDQPMGGGMNIAEDGDEDIMAT